MCAVVGNGGSLGVYELGSDIDEVGPGGCCLPCVCPFESRDEGSKCIGDLASNIHQALP